MVPNVKWESGCHPWEAAADLSYYSYRYELEWKDRVWCDASFYTAPAGRFIRCEFHNDTQDPQHVLLHWIVTLQAPGEAQAVMLPDGGQWLHALDYCRLTYARPPADDHLMPDALTRGEIRGGRFVAGSGLGRRDFGAAPGDQVVYALPVGSAGRELAMRYQARGPVVIHMAGAASGRFPLAPSDEPRLLVVPLGGPDRELRIQSEGGGAIEIHGLAVLPPGGAERLRFEPVRYRFAPERDRVGENAVLLRYADLNRAYGLAWSPAPHRVREFLTRDLEGVFHYNTHDHVAGLFRGVGEGHFTDIMCAPVTIPPRERRTMHALVSEGSPAAVRQALAAFYVQAAERAYAERRARRWTPSVKQFGFSQERLAATLLTNVVYPVYARRSWIKHNTPGRFWDSLYTWDSGFIALGLAQLDPQRALECVRAYTSEPGDPHYAYVQHGTPLPTQIYAFQELWPLLEDRSVLEFLYPRLRQMYLFLAGRIGGSTTRRLSSGLLQTWDYFYNTGWDDYPAQVYVHERKLAARVATAIVTSHMIRCAKSLSLMGAALGDDGDAGIYREDLARFTEALQKHSWDPEAGYFSYVVHDENGVPSGILRHASGQNFNMGMDGAAPLIAGICDGRQQSLLLERLMDPRRLWTPSGLTAVDQSAPYYRPDGYWNGSVWMPHQWFFWKSLLDHGRAREARQIAMTALRAYEAEVARTYHCFEHLIAASGRGAGWHQFGALSSPLLHWHAAYFRPGTLTTGFDGWIHRIEWSRGQLAAEIEFLAGPASKRTVLVVPREDTLHEGEWNGRPVAILRTPEGLEVELPGYAGRGRLSLR